MRDDFLTRDWAANHTILSGDIHKLIDAIAVGLAWLNAYQFDAPWKRDAVEHRRPAR